MGLLVANLFRPLNRFIGILCTALVLIEIIYLDPVTKHKIRVTEMSYRPYHSRVIPVGIRPTYFAYHNPIKGIITPCKRLQICQLLQSVYSLSAIRIEYKVDQWPYSVAVCIRDRHSICLHPSACIGMQCNFPGGRCQVEQIGILVKIDLPE